MSVKTLAARHVTRLCRSSVPFFIASLAMCIRSIKEPLIAVYHVAEQNKKQTAHANECIFGNASLHAMHLGSTAASVFFEQSFLFS